MHDRRSGSIVKLSGMLTQCNSELCFLWLTTTGPAGLDCITSAEFNELKSGNQSVTGLIPPSQGNNYFFNKSKSEDNYG